jgi:hypothetical protein
VHQVRPDDHGFESDLPAVSTGKSEKLHAGRGLWSERAAGVYSDTRPGVGFELAAHAFGSDFGPNHAAHRPQ